jgi:hypothetical protein
MPVALLTTTAFEKDVRRVGKQGKDLGKMEEIVNLLQTQRLCLPAAALMLCTAAGRDILTAMSSPIGSCCTE